VFALKIKCTVAKEYYRVIEPVIEQLIEWAAAALETTCNQPILPYAIIILNASESDIDPMLWNVDFATKVLLESLAESVNRTPAFVRHARFWRERGRVIQNVEDLVLCYYSSVRVCRSRIFRWFLVTLIVKTCRWFGFPPAGNRVSFLNKYISSTEKLNVVAEMQESEDQICECCLVQTNYRATSKMPSITTLDPWIFLSTLFRHHFYTTPFHSTLVVVF
jgi:hypothetical protein